MQHTPKTLCACKLSVPVVNYKSLFVIVPPRAELEIGFPVWLAKVFKLAAELSAPIDLACNGRTFRAITRFSESKELSAPINHNQVENWRQFPAHLRQLPEACLLILVSARMGHIAYSNQLAALPTTLAQRLPDWDKIVIYPE